MLIRPSSIMIASSACSACAMPLTKCCPIMAYRHCRRDVAAQQPNLHSSTSTCHPVSLLQPHISYSLLNRSMVPWVFPSQQCWAVLLRPIQQLSHNQHIPSVIARGAKLFNPNIRRTTWRLEAQLRRIGIAVARGECVWGGRRHGREILRDLPLC